ncbi:MAG: hypothetical protein IJT46_02965 [Bacteroidaceae bacterium]|nr:hypothetical protein [Bacteroidaceae bacterium]
MKLIANNVVSELIRLVPIIIDSVPPGQSLRVENAIRITKKILKKLNNLKEIEK